MGFLLLYFVHFALLLFLEVLPTFGVAYGCHQIISLYRDQQKNREDHSLLKKFRERLELSRHWKGVIEMSLVFKGEQSLFYLEEWLLSAVASSGFLPESPPLNRSILLPIFSISIKVTFCSKFS